MSTITPTASIKATEPILSHFEGWEKQRRSSDPDWLQTIRQRGMNHFRELGFPTAKNEEWRFTNIAPILKHPFRPVTEAGPHQVTPDTIKSFQFPGLEGTILVFVNGQYSGKLSARSASQDGVKVLNLAEAIQKEPALLKRHLAHHARADESAFTALNNAYFTDGAVIHIASGCQCEKPIFLLYISSAEEPGTTSHPRTLIIADKESKVSIIESYVSVGEVASFTNAVTELIIGENAFVEHCKLQDESVHAFHIATIHAWQDQNSNLLTHSISAGASIARNNISLVLDGEGIDSTMNGLYLAHGQQLVDHHTVVHHAKPNCNSHEYYHGILAGRARGVFNGKIFVYKGAQKTDAKQTNRNLLLTNEATVDTKPQLEIFADDVKCTHGATVGQLDEEAIFYLRSRGIGLQEAKRMLIYAFASEVINRIRMEPVRAQIDQLLKARLRMDLEAAGIPGSEV